MKTAVHFMKVAVKLLLLLPILPFVLIWIGIVWARYKSKVKGQLVACGMAEAAARDLVKDLRFVGVPKAAH